MSIRSLIRRVTRHPSRGPDSKKAAPADRLKRFDPFLGMCEYQNDFVSGGTRFTMTPDQLLAHPSASYFGFNGDKNIIFNATRSGTYQFRTELRHVNEWPASGRNVMTLRSKLSASTLNEYTFTQIHRKTPGANPPMRLAWVKSNSGYTDYLIAVVLRDNGTYERYPLAPRPAGFFDLHVELTANVVTVKINGATVYTQTLADWVYDTCYFKCGLYMTGSTSASGSATHEIADVSASNSVVTSVYKA